MRWTALPATSDRQGTMTHKFAHCDIRLTDNPNEAQVREGLKNSRYDHLRYSYPETFKLLTRRLDLSGPPLRPWDEKRVSEDPSKTKASYAPTVESMATPRGAKADLRITHLPRGRLDDQGEKEWRRNHQRGMTRHRKPNGGVYVDAVRTTVDAPQKYMSAMNARALSDPELRRPEYSRYQRESIRREPFAVAELEHRHTLRILKAHPRSAFGGSMLEIPAVFDKV